MGSTEAWHSRRCRALPAPLPPWATPHAAQVRRPTSSCPSRPARGHSAPRSWRPPLAWRSGGTRVALVARTALLEVNLVLDERGHSQLRAVLAKATQSLRNPSTALRLAEDWAVARAVLSANLLSGSLLRGTGPRITLRTPSLERARLCLVASSKLGVAAVSPPSRIKEMRHRVCFDASDRSAEADGAACFAQPPHHPMAPRCSLPRGECARCGSPGWTRTRNPSINSRMLCQLSYRGSVAAPKTSKRVGVREISATWVATRYERPVSLHLVLSRVEGLPGGVSTNGLAGSMPSSYSNATTARGPRRGAPGDHPHPAVALDGHVPLEHDGRGDPLADQLEEAARLGQASSYVGRGSPQVPTSLTRSVSESRSQSAARPASRAPGAVAGRAGRAPPGCPRPRRPTRPGQHPLPAATRRKGRPPPPHCVPTMRSRSLRRCSSSAASSPNIRLYDAACSTGLVRWSRDLIWAIRRSAVSSISPTTCCAT